MAQKRLMSPFDPSKKAYLEPIEQPLYSSAILTAAAPERLINFFPIPAASIGDSVRSNIDQNRLANPKMFVVRGWRLHIQQDVAFVAGDAANVLALPTILENYFYRFFVGTKDYLVLPAFAVPDGLGVWLSAAAAGAEAANEIITTATNGFPAIENYRKLRRNQITIPPQQEFIASLQMSNTNLASFTGAATRRIWNFLEGTLGREVQ